MKPSICDTIDSEILTLIPLIDGYEDSFFNGNGRVKYKKLFKTNNPSKWGAGFPNITLPCFIQVAEYKNVIIVGYYILLSFIHSDEKEWVKKIDKGPFHQSMDWTQRIK